MVNTTDVGGGIRELSDMKGKTIKYISGDSISIQIIFTDDSEITISATNSGYLGILSEVVEMKPIKEQINLV